MSNARTSFRVWMSLSVMIIMFNIIIFCRVCMRFSASLFHVVPTWWLTYLRRQFVYNLFYHLLYYVFCLYHYSLHLLSVFCFLFCFLPFLLYFCLFFIYPLSFYSLSFTFEPINSFIVSLPICHSLHIVNSLRESSSRALIIIKKVDALS